MDVQEALYRFFDNEILYFKFLAKFLEDNNFTNLRNCLSEGLTKEAFFYAHTLKGIISNLALKGLYEKLNIVVEHLRGDDLEKARNSFFYLEENYNCICEIIRINMLDL